MKFLTAKLFVSVFMVYFGFVWKRRSILASIHNMCFAHSIAVKIQKIYSDFVRSAIARHRSTGAVYPVPDRKSSTYASRTWM